MKQAENQKEREAGMMAITGIQGVGKTYLNMHIIKEYVKDKFYNKVRGRKCLIMDTNGEYTKEQFKKNDIDGVDPKTIAVKDIPAWCRSEGSECRRIDAKNISIDEKIAIVEFIIAQYRNGMFVLEDINTYILSMTFMKDIVGGLVNLRHRAVDVLISYQSARPVEPRIWQNARWVRMHYQADNVTDIKGKLPNPTMYKIAQIIVNNRYFNGDKRFYVYIHNFANKIEGAFTKTEFKTACSMYLSSNKKYIKEHADMMQSKDLDAAKEHLAKQYFEMYYGNTNK
jgi:hypothetical protein